MATSLVESVPLEERAVQLLKAMGVPDPAAVVKSNSGRLQQFVAELEARIEHEVTADDDEDGPKRKPITEGLFPNVGMVQIPRTTQRPRKQQVYATLRDALNKIKTPGFFDDGHCGFGDTLLRHLEMAGRSGVREVRDEATGRREKKGGFNYWAVKRLIEALKEPPPEGAQIEMEGSTIGIDYQFPPGAADEYAYQKLSGGTMVIVAQPVDPNHRKRVVVNLGAGGGTNQSEG